jgi:hypothetical protein
MSQHASSEAWQSYNTCWLTCGWFYTLLAASVYYLGRCWCFVDGCYSLRAEGRSLLLVSITPADVGALWKAVQVVCWTAVEAT